MLVCGDSIQLVHQNHQQQHNQFLDIIPHYCRHFHQNPILWRVYFEIPGLKFLRWNSFFNITLLWGTKPDSQLTQTFSFRNFYWKLADGCSLKEIHIFSLVILIVIWPFLGCMLKIIIFDNCSTDILSREYKSCFISKFWWIMSLHAQ